MEIRACFPEASSISISVTTTDEEIDRFSNELTDHVAKNCLQVITTMDATHNDSDRRFTRYCYAGAGIINLTKDGS